MSGPELIDLPAARAGLPDTAISWARLLSWLAQCTLCGDCLDACPVYNGELANWLGAGSRHHSEHAPLADLVAVARWLTACSGCGRCEAACEQGIPLGLLVSALRGEE